MDLNPLQLLRAGGRRLAVVYGRDGELRDVPVVYVLHRVGSPEFLRLAMMAIGQSDREAKEEETLRYRQLGATPEKAAEIAAQVEAEAERKALEFQLELLRSPDKIEALMASSDGLVTASVVAMGLGRLDLEVPLPEGLLPLGTRPEDVCQRLGDVPDAPLLQAVRWAEPGAPESADTIRITAIHEGERMILASLVSEAFSPTKADRAVFPGSGAARDGAPVGDPVRPKAKRSGRVRGSGDGGGVRSGGARRR